MKSKLEIYALAVCFAAMISLVISTAISGYAVFRIVAPELTMSKSDYDPLQSNDAYWKYSQPCCSAEEKKVVRPPEAELTIKREQAYAVAVNSEKRDGLQSLIFAFIYLLISVIVLIVHWVIAKRSRA